MICVEFPHVGAVKHTQARGRVQHFQVTYILAKREIHQQYYWTCAADKKSEF